MYKLILISYLLINTITVTAQEHPSNFSIIPNQTTDGTSNVQFQSLSNALDGPKVQQINSTVFDWWYFDAVSNELDCNVVFTFYTSNGSGLIGLDEQPSTSIYVDIAANFRNGTVWTASLPAYQAVITTLNDGSSGFYDELGGWVGEPDMSSYTVYLHAPGVEGTLTMQSIAPAHFPCSAATSDPGQTLEVCPHIGWFNAVPDANATVDLRIEGQLLKFSGPGYHDKNWGSVPFRSAVNSWYWGHGRVGPYSLVWFDVIASDGQEYVSGYASADGKIVASSCSGISVRPIGRHADYPPTPTSGPPEGFHISLDLGSSGTLEVNVTSKHTVLEIPETYSRWIGSLSARVENGARDEEIWEGLGLYEEFTFTH